MSITPHVVILVVYVGAFICLALSFGPVTLHVLASIATILSLTLVPLLYFLNWFDERIRISRNLYMVN